MFKARDTNMSGKWLGIQWNSNISCSYPEDQFVSDKHSVILLTKL